MSRVHVYTYIANSRNHPFEPNKHKHLLKCDPREFDRFAKYIQIYTIYIPTRCAPTIVINGVILPMSGLING